MANCKHHSVNLIGSEETGLQRAECRECGIPMTRRIIDGEYDYIPMPGEVAPEKKQVRNEDDYKAWLREDAKKFM